MEDNKLNITGVNATPSGDAPIIDMNHLASLQEESLVHNSLLITPNRRKKLISR